MNEIVIIQKLLNNVVLEAMACIQCDTKEETNSVLTKHHRYKDELLTCIYQREQIKRHRMEELKHSISRWMRRMVIAKKLISTEDVTSNESNHKCPTCVDKEVNHCIKTCGHTFCEECVQKIRNECFVCRKFCVKPDIIKIYFN